jgi:hypothetical protein
MSGMVPATMYPDDRKKMGCSGSEFFLSPLHIFHGFWGCGDTWSYVFRLRTAGMVGFSVHKWRAVIPWRAWNSVLRTSPFIDDATGGLFHDM